jgi:hypothetical protein
MNKMQLLKKQLVKCSLIAAVAASASSAVAYSVYSWSDSVLSEKQKLERDLSRTRGNVNSLESKHREAQQYLEFYSKITSDSEQDKISDLSRQKAEVWLKSAATRSNIMNMDGKVEPIEWIDSPAFKKQTFEGITSKVLLTFDAMTDEQAYQFMQDVERGFPGYIKITHFKLKKNKEIDDAVLIGAGKGDFPPLVTGELGFNWIGVREVAQDDTTGQGS